MREPKLTTSQLASAKAAKAKGMQNGGACYVCDRKLWLNFYFDENGQDVFNDGVTENMSNIGKLFSTRLIERDRIERGIYDYYTPGLGMPFVPGAQTKSAVARTTAKAAVKGSVKEAGIEAAVDLGKSAITSKGANIAGAVLHQVTPGKLVEHVKGAGLDIVAVVAQQAVENMDSIRDTKAAAKYWLSGATTRIDDAIQFFRQVISNQTDEVVEINISVFGGGWGGGMARGFVNKLINDVLLGNSNTKGDLYIRTGQYKTAKVSFKFLGLFDCISSNAPWAIDRVISLIGFGSIKVKFDFDMGIPAAVENALHIYAAHEQRQDLRLDSIRKAKGAKKELGYPGVHRDIVGGYAPAVLERSNELARIPLWKMYGEAVGAGVPLPDYEKIANVRADIYRLFKVADDDLYSMVERVASAYTGKVDDVADLGRKQRIAWLAKSFQFALKVTEEQKNFLRAHISDAKADPDFLSGQSAGSSLYRDFLSGKASAQTMEDVFRLMDGYIHDSFIPAPNHVAVGQFATNGYFLTRRIDASNDVSDAGEDKVLKQQQMDAREYQRMR